PAVSCEALAMTKIEIETADGLCPSYVFRPPAANRGPWPGAIVYMDGLGIRPAILAVAERLATYGYFVLLPDLFYRAGPYAPMDAKEVFSSPEKLEVLRTKFF